VQVIALSAVSQNPKYLACVPHFIDFWINLGVSRRDVKFVPKVIVLAKDLPLELEPYRQWCETFDLEDSMSPTFASQTIRILKPGLERADYVLTTDIDMLPLTDRVFQRGLETLQNGADFVVCRDVLEPGQFAICYNLATPDVWQQVNGIDSVTKLRQKLLSLFKKSGIEDIGKSDPGGPGWFSDQEILYSMVIGFEKKGGRVSKLNDADTGHKRLDRFFMPFPLNWLFLRQVTNGDFTDYHVHHPVIRYKKFIHSVGKAARKAKQC